MINTLQRTDVETIKDYLAFELVPVLFDMVVLYHDYNHIHIIDELIKVRELVLGNLVVSQEGIVAFQRTSKMTLLKFQHLEGWRLAIVIDVLLVGEAVKTDLAVVCNPVLFHNFVDAVENELRLAVVGLH